MLAITPSVQSPSAYDQNNTSGSTAKRLAARSRMQSSDYRHKIHPNETAAGLIDSDLLFGYEPGDARRLGWDPAASASTNKDAVDQSVAAQVQGNGGRVWLAGGEYACNALANIPAQVEVCGSNKRGTKITYSGASIFATLGGTAGALYYGSGLKRLAIFLEDDAAEAVRIKGVAGGFAKDVYIQGPINSTRATNGLVIDGGNASCFLNTIENVYCNHIANSFKILTSGSVAATNQLFRNCSAYGDVATDTDSVAISIASGQGHGTNWYGGNIENCGKGILAKTGAGNVKFWGTRFEPDNTTDVEYEATPNPISLFGCMGIDTTKIVDNSGTGYESHNLFDCTAPDGSLVDNAIHGLTRWYSKDAATPCAIFRGYSGQTGAIVRVVDSSGSLLIALNGDGSIVQAYRSGSGTPQAAVTPIFVGEEYLDTATNKWYKSSGLVNTNWQALN